MLRLLPLIAMLLSGCRSAPDQPDIAPRVSDGRTARTVPSLDLPDNIDLRIRRDPFWRFADQLPLDREVAYADYVQHAPGGRIGAESLTSDTSQLIAERAHDWWLIGLSLEPLRPAQYEEERRYTDTSLPPLGDVRAFLVSPDFVTWANQLGMHLYSPLDRPEDNLFEHVYIDRANASGPLVLHSSIRSLIVDLAKLDPVDVDALVEQLPTVTKLERVKVSSRDVERTRRFFAALPKQHIRTINFSGDPLPVSSIISSFPRLARLYIRYKPTEEIEAAVIDSKIPTRLAGLSASKSLEELKIYDNPRRSTFLYGEGALDEIVGIAKLRVLELPDAGLTDEHVRKIATMPSLEALDVSHQNVAGSTNLFSPGTDHIPGRLTDEAVVALARSKSIRRLNVDGYPLTARAHGAFAGWENLVDLSIQFPFESSPEWIAKMPNLERVVLFSHGHGKLFTPAQLSVIEENSSLEYIAISQEIIVEFIPTERKMELLRVLDGSWTRRD